MDEWLDSVGLYRKNTALDGSCLFRAVSEQLLPANPVNGHLVLRKQCVEYMRKNRSLFEDMVCVDYDEYLAALSMNKGWGTVLELKAISKMYQVDFLCFLGPGEPMKVTKNNYKRELMLCVTGESYYDAVYKKSYIETLGFCQSIVYKVLYEDVLKLTDLDYAVDKMLHDKAARMQRERYLTQKCISAGRDEIGFDYLDDAGETVNVRKVLDSGAILFPYKVAKALDPDMYRNTEFDIWVESQRGKPWPSHCLCNFEVTRRNNFWFGLRGPLRVGVKCHVRFEGKILTGHVQDLAPDRGPALVFIEELSQKVTVPYDDLIPQPRSNLRPEWSYAHKGQMISKFTGKNCRDLSPVRRGQCSGRRTPGQRFLPGESGMTPEADSALQSPQSLMPQSPPRVMICTPDGSCHLVDVSVTMSNSCDFTDLPLYDLATVRFFYNMGIEYFNKGSIFNGPLKEAQESLYPTPESSPPMMPTFQGAPFFHPPPILPPFTPQTPPMIMETPPTEPEFAENFNPLFSAIPPVSCEPPFESQNIQDTPVAPREGKKGNGRYNKPPRFQRLEAFRAACNAKRNAERDENQVTEDTSAKEPAPMTIPVVQSPFTPNYVYNEGGEMMVPEFVPMPMDVSYVQPVEVPYLQPIDGMYNMPLETPVSNSEFTPLYSYINPEDNLSHCMVYPPIFYQ